MINIDQLHESYRNPNSKGYTTRMLVEAIQNTDFTPSGIVIVGYNQKYADELSRRAIVIAESIGFRNVIRLNRSEILINTIKIVFLSHCRIYAIPKEFAVFQDHFIIWS